MTYKQLLKEINDKTVSKGKIKIQLGNNWCMYHTVPRAALKKVIANGLKKRGINLKTICPWKRGLVGNYDAGKKNSVIIQLNY